MGFKFERLRVWHLSLEYVDTVYSASEKLPPSEKYNLKSQIRRAATSVALNIAEGSTSQSDAEQARFLGMAIRSLVETVACLRLMERRYTDTVSGTAGKVSNEAEMLFAKLQAMRRSVQTKS